VGCCILTLGQYLSPSDKHHPVARFLQPTEFDELKRLAISFGFGHVESGPLVRSSYHAADQATGLEQAKGTRGVGALGADPLPLTSATAGTDPLEFTHPPLQGDHSRR
jgi:hypothetical protein